MDYTKLIYCVLAASLLALGFAYYFYRDMLSKDEGTDLMKKIAAHVRQGAMAYLKQQYKVVIIVFAILAVLFWIMSLFDLQNGWVWFAFLTGGFFSGLAGFFGMKTATYASGHDNKMIVVTHRHNIQKLSRKYRVSPRIIQAFHYSFFVMAYLITSH